jgi:tetratricopeptide (TPR) repeat protein
MMGKDLFSAVIIVFLIIAAGYYFFAGGEVESRKNRNARQQDSSGLKNLQSGIMPLVESGSYVNALEQIKVLFAKLPSDFVQPAEIELLVTACECFPMNIYQQYRMEAKTWKNPYLKNTFQLFDQLKSFLEKGEIQWNEFIKCMEFDVRPFVYLSQNWFYEIALKRKKLFEGIDKRMMGIFIHMYLIDRKKVISAVNAAQLKKNMKNRLKGIFSAINAHSYYKQHIVQPSGASPISKKKAEIPAAFKAALKLHKGDHLEKAFLQYIIAFCQQPGILLLEDRNLKHVATDQFLNRYYKEGDNNPEIELFVGFIHLMFRNYKTAGEVLSLVRKPDLKKLADRLIEMMSRKSIRQILNSVDRSKYVMKVSGLRLKRPGKVTATIPVAVASAGTDRSTSEVEKKLLAQKDKFVSAGKLNEAIDILKRLLKMEKKSSYMIEMGQLYERLGMQSYAIDVFEEAVRLDPEKSGLMVHLADLCYAQKEIGKAKVHYGTALFNESDPELLKKCREKILELSKM